jgi:Xaa-Pro aminopeptidase
VAAFFFAKVHFVDERVEKHRLRCSACSLHKEAFVAVKNYRVYQERRHRLGNMLGNNGVLILPGAKSVTRNGDIDYPFRQESNFLYLTGFTEPDAMLVITGGTTPRSILFCNPKNAEQEIWTGKRFGPEAAQKEFGFIRTFANADTEDMIGSVVCKFIAPESTVYCPEGLAGGIQLREYITSIQRVDFSNSDHLIGEMRLIKDASEVTQMTHAAKISAQSHREVLTLIRPGMTEVELEAEFTYRFRKQGGDACHAYPPIVATGAHACTLHHVSTNARIKNGDLVLVDAGCEYGGYASDITRTFPANGTFTTEQHAIYSLVLTAQKAAIAMAKPGMLFCEIHDKAVKVVTEGLMKLGLIEQMKLDDAIRHQAHRKFFPHGTSHWLGLDVHDVGDYRRNAAREPMRILEPGMVLTVEPGIYIQPDTTGVHKKWYGIGVRIEDDILITDTGNHVLSNAPKEVRDIERLMSKDPHKRLRY